MLSQAPDTWFQLSPSSSLPPTLALFLEALCLDSQGNKGGAQQNRFFSEDAHCSESSPSKVLSLHKLNKQRCL